MISSLGIKKILQVRKLCILLPVVYASLMALALILRKTPLNYCEPRDFILLCFGTVDLFIFLLNLPGWMFWLTLIMAAKFIPSSTLNLKLGLDKFILPSVYPITFVFWFIYGSLLDKPKRKKNKG